MKNKVTVTQLWIKIKNSERKPKPVKKILEQCIEELNTCIENEDPDEVVKQLFDAEEGFKNINKPIAMLCIYKSLIGKKAGMFEPTPKSNPLRFKCKIYKAYFLERFVTTYGEPPYVLGKGKIPEKIAVKRQNLKYHPHCPECGYDLQA